MSDYQPEIETHKVAKAEQEFYSALCVVVKHLSDRALAAEAEVVRLRKELDIRREQVEYYQKPTVSVEGT